LFALYGLTLKLANEKKIDVRQLWKIIIPVSLILFLAYNAFSYDLFNYIFDAKIVTHYHLNPYQHKALDFPGDPMLSFMHWTHRVYPYGPAWLLLTVPISFVGFGYFIVTFYLFKLLMLASFIGSVYLISKIAKKIELNVQLAIVAFALNPLVLIESLVSAHNDIVMIFFGLCAVYLYLEKKLLGSFFTIEFSAAIKFATGFLLIGLIIDKFAKLNKQKFIYLLTALGILATILATNRTQFQPWYLIYFLPFAAFAANKKFVLIPIFVISLFALLEYLPYLYLGNWDPPVPFILNNITYGSIIISIVLVIFISATARKKA